MDLFLYLESRNITLKEFARMIDVHPATLSNYKSRNRKPTLEIGCRIVEKTKGKVTMIDLLKYWETDHEKLD